MSEMVERVAIAIGAQFYGSGPSTCLSEFRLNLCREMARAAIEAMREPTEAMLQTPIPKSGSFDDCYRAMIDAALEVKP